MSFFLRASVSSRGSSFKGATFWPPRRSRQAHSMRAFLRVLLFLYFLKNVTFLYFFFCDFLLASISPWQLGLLWRYHGAPRALLGMLRGVPAAPFEHSLAKEARRYVTFCEHCCQVCDFLEPFGFFRINLTNKPEFWRASSSPRQSGLFGHSHGTSGRCRSAPGMLLDAFRTCLLYTSPSPRDRG